MSLMLMIVVLALGWAMATGSFTLPDLLFGGVIGALALFLVRDQVIGAGVLQRLRRIAGLSAVFIYELFLSAFKVALLVLRPDMRKRLTPGMIAFPLSVTSDAEITLLANLITLTPGTLSVDVSEDRKLLYVHALNVNDREALIRSIALGFERRVKEALR